MGEARLRYCEGSRTRAEKLLRTLRVNLHNKIDKGGLEKMDLEAC